MSKLIQIDDRAIAMSVTTAKYRRPENPKRCSSKRYHIWLWRGGPIPPPTLSCQCGLLKEPPTVHESVRSRALQVEARPG